MQGPTDKDQEITAFVSYAREDSDAARRLYKDLKNASVIPWLDKESLIAGQNWKIAINKAIKKSRYFIPIFSSTSVAKRGYVQKEFKYALDVFDEFPESQIFVIPVRLDDCEIPYEKLKDIEYVDLFPDWNEGLEKIIQAITYKQPMADKTTHPPVPEMTYLQPMADKTTHPSVQDPNDAYARVREVVFLRN